jgi:hypothetical protein
LRVITNSGLQIPIGARMRVAINGTHTLFLEYQYEREFLFSDRGGLLERPHTLSLIHFDKQNNTFYGCGISMTIHHPWSNETHSPESSNYLYCKIGKRF